MLAARVPARVAPSPGAVAARVPVVSLTVPVSVTVAAAAAMGGAEFTSELSVESGSLIAAPATVGVIVSKKFPARSIEKTVATSAVLRPGR